MARPTAEESRRRMIAWLEQVAQGVPGARAAKWAGVDFARALNLACDPMFPAVLIAVRRGFADELRFPGEEAEAA